MALKKNANIEANSNPKIKVESGDRASTQGERTVGGSTTSGNCNDEAKAPFSEGGNDNDIMLIPL